MTREREATMCAVDQKTKIFGAKEGENPFFQFVQPIGNKLKNWRERYYRWTSKMIRSTRATLEMKNEKVEEKVGNGPCENFHRKIFSWHESSRGKQRWIDEMKYKDDLYARNNEGKIKTKSCKGITDEGDIDKLNRRNKEQASNRKINKNKNDCHRWTYDREEKRNAERRMDEDIWRGKTRMSTNKTGKIEEQREHKTNQKTQEG